MHLEQDKALFPQIQINQIKIIFYLKAIQMIIIISLQSLMDMGNMVITYHNYQSAFYKNILMINSNNHKTHRLSIKKHLIIFKMNSIRYSNLMPIQVDQLWSRLFYKVICVLVALMLVIQEPF